MNLSDLTFNEVDHTYRLDGFLIPSVTTIMKPLSAVEYGSIPQHILDAAAQKGTAVHESCENYLKYGIEDCEEAYRPYFDAFLKWHERYKPDLLASEMQTYHKVFMYAGTVDFVGIIDNKVTLVDFKTTAKLITKNCGVQLEAYARALGTHGIEIDEKRILQLRKDGSYVEERFEMNDMKNWKVFDSLLTIHNFIKE